MEVWKDIPGYEGKYQVSNLGRVKSLNYHREHREGMVNIRPIWSGYMKCSLGINGRMKTFAVHRLVAKAFVPNPENKPEVNHINGIKSDNRAENLEWTTGSENQRHALRSGLRRSMVELRNKNEKPCICVETGVEYDSISQAELHTNIAKTNIVACCRGKRRKAGGYTWRYKEAE